MRIARCISIAAISLFALTACEKESREPQTASSANQTRYAESYPDKINDASGDFEQSNAGAVESSSKLDGFSAEIKDPSDHNKVVEVYKAADESGRSDAYVKRARENKALQDILEENDGEIGKKVAGAAHFTAKQQGCTADVGSAAAGAMKRAFEKRMQDRLKETNRAYEVIEANEEALGKNNVKTLETQADEIAHTSYVVNIELPTQRNELERMSNERNQVAETIDQRIEAEQKLQAKADVSDSDKRASQTRLEKLNAAKQKLAEAQQYDAERLKKLDEQIKQSQQAYNDAFAKLIDAEEERGGGKKDEPADGDAKVEASGSLGGD